MKISILLLSLFVTTSVFAARIAVIDSGTDYKHELIAPYQWINPVDVPNSQDDDNNKYVDDIYGWNFAENNNEVIDYKYLGTFSDDCYKFFEVQLKGFLGTITEEEKQWLKEKREDEEFIKELSTFGNFMHGTHVTGISVRDSKNNVTLAIKLLPTSVNAEDQDEEGMAMYRDLIEGMNKDIFGEMLLKYLLSQAAQRQMTQLKEVATYISGHKMEVANGSFGVSYDRAKDLVRQLYPQIVGEEPTEAKVDEITRYFLDENLKYGKDFVGAAPNTLFVFAAGNDGANNDEKPSSPTNIKTDNVISVAATVSLNKIAPFSNYGVKMVDVAAPGVGIVSSIPTEDHAGYLAVSGTSQAAPFVTNVAGEVKEINASLSPKQVKDVLMGTVDYKDFLRGKVKTGGIVNPERARHAAKLSLTMNLDKAIKASRTAVVDVEDDTFKAMGDEMLDYIYAVPFPPMYRF